MKKLKFLGVMAMAALLFTSCLDGGSNEISGPTYGVVKLSSKSYKNLLHELTGLTVYHPNLEALQSGDCLACYRKINQDDAVNQSATEYLTASELTYQKIDQRPLMSVLKDTTVFDDKEMTVLDVGIVGYVEGMLFIQSAHPNAASDQTVEVSLSYNHGQEVETVNGEDVYNLFLRSKKLTDGKNTSGNVIFETAFRMEEFFSYACNVEKGKGKEVVKFRFNYIKEFDKDSINATWGTSKVIDYQIPTQTN